MHTQGELAHNLTIRIPKELYDELRRHPEINWSTVLRAALNQFLQGELTLSTTADRGPKLTLAKRLKA